MWLYLSEVSLGHVHDFLWCTQTLDRSTGQRKNCISTLKVLYGLPCVSHCQMGVIATHTWCPQCSRQSNNLTMVTNEVEVQLNGS